MRPDYDFDSGRPNPYLARLATRTNLFESDPDVLGGTPVFSGTRVPVRALFDHLAGGGSAAEFLDDYPSVTAAQVVASLELAGDTLSNVLSVPLVEHLLADARRRIQPLGEAKGYLTDEDVFRDIS